MKIGDSAVLRRSVSAADAAEFAALTGAGGTMEVPDALIAGLFSAVLGTQLPGPGTGWLKQELHYPGRAALREPLLLRVEITRLRADKRLADLMCICTGNEGRLIAHGRALMLLSPQAGLQI